MNKTAHLLIVDDDPIIRDLLHAYLTGEGFQVSCAEDGASLRQFIQRGQPVDAVILDLQLPDESGLMLTRFLREHTRSLVMILTAKTDPIDRVVGLEIGADDYITKPFEPREVLIRLRKLLSQRSMPPDASAPAETPAAPHPPSAAKGSIIHFAHWTLDMNQCLLRGPNGCEIPLTKGEYTLLLAFLQHPERVLNRDQLLDLTHGDGDGPFDRGIDLQVSRLRRKLQDDSTNPKLIKTVRGFGYLFAVSPKAN